MLFADLASQSFTGVQRGAVVSSEQRAVRGWYSVAARGAVGLVIGAAIGHLTLTEPDGPPLGGAWLGGLLGLGIGLLVGVFMWTVYPYLGPEEPGSDPESRPPKE